MPRPPYQQGRQGLGPGPARGQGLGPGYAQGQGLGYVSEVEKSLASESLLLYVGDSTPRMPKHSHLLNTNIHAGGDTGVSRLAQVVNTTN